jgi:hypothetical protein
VSYIKKPVLDYEGDPVYESKNKVMLERDIMSHSFHYFDDIVCSTEPKRTYRETLDYHFECLEKVISRLSFHNVKLSVNRSEFAKVRFYFWDGLSVTISLFLILIGWIK